MKRNRVQFAVIALVLLVLSSASLAEKKSKAEKQQGTLNEYMKQLAVPAPTSFATTRGSLFSSSGLLADPYSDFKAHLVGDSISIQICESTTISQSGNVATERTLALQRRHRSRRSGPLF